MLLGYDAKRIVRNGTGLGSYSRTLVNSLAALPADSGLQLRLYAPDSGREELRRQVADAPNVRFVYPANKPFRWQKDWWRTHGIVHDLRRDGIQLFHGLSGELPVGIRRSGIRSVLTVHDLIFLVHPEYYHWLDVQIYRRKFHASLREADRIVAISECTKRDIMRFGHVAEEKIEVVYQSCDVRFKSRVSEATKAEVRSRWQLPEHYILSVGTIEARKNLLIAVQALAALPAGIHLVAVGRQTAYASHVLSWARSHGLEHRLHLLSGVPNDDLQAIYQQAACFVYPSRYEGFGIPVIEAVQSGLPVVAATGSCLEETGGPDCLYVSPDDAEALAATVRQVMPGAAHREERIRRSQKYVERFENADVARQMLSVYERTLADGPQPSV